MFVKENRNSKSGWLKRSLKYLVIRVLDWASIAYLRVLTYLQKRASKTHKKDLNYAGKKSLCLSKMPGQNVPIEEWQNSEYKNDRRNGSCTPNVFVSQGR